MPTSLRRYATGCEAASPCFRPAGEVAAHLSSHLPLSKPQSLDEFVKKCNEGARPKGNRLSQNNQKRRG